MSAIRSAAGGDTERRKRESTRVPAARRLIQARLSAMMNKVTNVCWKFERHRTRKQHSMPEPALETAHRRTRFILAIGLGGMILLMLAAGIDAVRVLRRFASKMH